MAANLPENWPAMTIAQANAALSAPGSPLALDEVEIDGVVYDNYAAAPPNLRALFQLGQMQFATRDFLVYEGERVTYDAMTRAVAHFAAA